jgi:DNA-binding helix-hairpin-helix protein with protein kinase domain
MTLHIRHHERTVPLHLGERLGAGAQGTVYAMPDTDGIAVKLYFRPTDELNDRVSGLARLGEARGLVQWQPESGIQIAWPAAIVQSESAQVRGFVMPRVRRATLLHSYLNPGVRTDGVRGVTWATKVRLARLIAETFDQLHTCGLVIGDISPGNIMVATEDTDDGRTAFGIALIDCDGIQFIDLDTGCPYPALTVTPEYSSPEALRDGTGSLTVAHDLFGLAVLICQLLMEGQHPYDGVTADGTDDGIRGNIASGACRPFAHERFRPVAFDLNLDILGPALTGLAQRALIDGHIDPIRRPTAVEWRNVLARIDGGLMGCRHNPSHFYQGSLTDCIWCARSDGGFGEHYPLEHDGPRVAAVHSRDQSGAS